MSDIRLVVNGRYETIDGYQVTIVKELQAVNKSDAREEYQFELGFRFMSDKGTVYTEIGRIDVERPCHLDLVKPIPLQYMVVDKRDQSLCPLMAYDPENAIVRFAEIKEIEDGVDYADSVYELNDVTPSRSKLQVSLSSDEISDRIDFMIKTCREVWDKYRIDKDPKTIEDKADG